MSYDSKTPLVLLFLVVGFLYLAFIALGHHGGWLDTPLAFGKVVNRLVFDDKKPPSGILFVGDVMLARDVERKLKVVGLNYPFSQVGKLFERHFVFGNFEAVVPKIHRPTPDFNTRFSVKSENLDALVLAKFTHWSLANNHAYDFDNNGLDETIQQLNLRGFATFGHPNVVASSSITEVLVNKQKIAVIGINAVTKDPEIELLKSLIDSSKKQNDYVVAYVHWGDEYKLVHNMRQENLAHLMIDLGVDLVVGHHPHVVQDIELYNDRLIVYSLGNFLFDQYFSDDVQEGLTIKLLPSDNKLSISLMPVTSLDSKIQPRLLTDQEKEEFLKELAGRSSKNLYESIIKGEIELNF